jgi:hypothetical protein
MPGANTQTLSSYRNTPNCTMHLVPEDTIHHSAVPAQMLLKETQHLSTLQKPSTQKVKEEVSRAMAFFSWNTLKT